MLVFCIFFPLVGQKSGKNCFDGWIFGNVQSFTKLDFSQKEKRPRFETNTPSRWSPNEGTGFWGNFKNGIKLFLQSLGNRGCNEFKSTDRRAMGNVVFVSCVLWKGFGFLKITFEFLCLVDARNCRLPKSRHSCLLAIWGKAWMETVSSSSERCVSRECVFNTVYPFPKV